MKPIIYLFSIIFITSLIVITSISTLLQSSISSPAPIPTEKPERLVYTLPSRATVVVTAQFYVFSSKQVILLTRGFQIDILGCYNTKLLHISFLGQEGVILSEATNISHLVPFVCHHSI